MTMDELPPLTLQDLELTAEAIVAADGADLGPVGALIASAFLRLVHHSNKTCLGTFEDSLADPEQPLIRDVELDGETFHVPGDRPYGVATERMREFIERAQRAARAAREP